MVQAGRRSGRRRRAAVRGLDRQGRHRGPVTDCGVPRRDQGERRRHGRRRCGDRGDLGRSRCSRCPRPRLPFRHPHPLRLRRRQSPGRPRKLAPPPPARAPAPAPAPPAPAPVASAAEPAAANSKLLSPVVRRLVAEHGLDPAAISGTGAGGRITREDVLDHIDKRVATAPALLLRQRHPQLRRPRRHRRPRRTTRGRPDRAARPARRGRHPLRRSASSPATTWSCRSRRRRTRSVWSRSTTRTSTASAACTWTTWRAQEGFTLTYLPFVARAIIDAIARVPADERDRRRRRAHPPPLRRPRHRRRSRLRGSARAGHPRRRCEAPARDRP